MFNYRLSSVRRIVENAIGSKAEAVQAEIATVDNPVWAAVLLHSFLRTCDEDMYLLLMLIMTTIVASINMNSGEPTLLMKKKFTDRKTGGQQ